MAVIVKGNQFTGPRARIEFRGQVIAWASGVSLTSSRRYEPHTVIGSLEKTEDVPVAYEPGFTAGQVILVNQSVVTLQMAPSIGQDPTEHLLNLLTLGEAEAVIMDQVSSVMQALVEGVKLASDGFNMSAQALVMNDMQFVCRRIRYLGS